MIDRSRRGGRDRRARAACAARGDAEGRLDADLPQPGRAGRGRVRDRPRASSRSSRTARSRSSTTRSTRSRSTRRARRSSSRPPAPSSSASRRASRTPTAGSSSSASGTPRTSSRFPVEPGKAATLRGTRKALKAAWRPGYQTPKEPASTRLSRPLGREPNGLQNARERLEALLAERIAVLDGSWGVLLQNRGLTEEEWRGERFRDHPRDVKGDPDLLNLTRPEIVESVHRAYFEAGADIATTNTFTATSIGQADYALEASVRDMNLEGARLARKVADEHDGFVAGSVGPLNVTLSLSPKVEDPAYRAVRFDDVVEAYAEQMRGAAGRRRRPAPDRDDLRHAEREGRDRRRAGGRARAAALDLVHRDRPQRPQPLRPDGRGVLDLGRARAAADRRRQLLARRARDAAGDRGALPHRDHVGVVPPERRPAERARRATTSSRTRPSALLGEFATDGLPQRRRRLLRHDAGAHRQDRRPRSDGLPTPRRSPAPPRAPALQRPRAVRDRRGHRAS